MLPVFWATEWASEALGPSVRGVGLRQRFTTMVEAWETRSLSEARVGRGKQDGCPQQCPEVPLLADWHGRAISQGHTMQLAPARGSQNLLGLTASRGSDGHSAWSHRGQ